MAKKPDGRAQEIMRRQALKRRAGPPSQGEGCFQCGHEVGHARDCSKFTGPYQIPPPEEPAVSQARCTKCERPVSSPGRCIACIREEREKLEAAEAVKPLPTPPMPATSIVEKMKQLPPLTARPMVNELGPAISEAMAAWNVGQEPPVQMPKKSCDRCGLLTSNLGICNTCLYNDAKGNAVKVTPISEVCGLVEMLWKMPPEDFEQIAALVRRLRGLPL